LKGKQIMSITTLKKAAKRKAAAEPYLEQAANKLREAKRVLPDRAAASAAHEYAARFITKSNQLLKGKTNV
jgi:hypothetical protein